MRRRGDSRRRDGQEKKDCIGGKMRRRAESCRRDRKRKTV